MLMGILTLGPYFAVTQLKTSAVCKQKMLCGLCDKNINIPGVARFVMAFCFSLVTVIFTIVLWINKDRLVEGVVDEKIGEDEDGVGVRVDADEDAAAMNRAAVKRKSCCKKKGAHGAAEDGDGQAGDDSAMGEDGAIPAEAKHDRTWPRMPWNMQCFELSIVAFMVIAFTVPSQALAAFIVMVANRVSSGEDEDTVIIDFDKQLGIPTNGVMCVVARVVVARRRSRRRAFSFFSPRVVFFFSPLVVARVFAFCSCFFAVSTCLLSVIRLRCISCIAHLCPLFVPPSPPPLHTATPLPAPTHTTHAGTSLRRNFQRSPLDSCSALPSRSSSARWSSASGSGRRTE